MQVIVHHVTYNSAQYPPQVIDSVHQLILKEWGPECLGSLPKGAIQELLIEVLNFIHFLIILYLLSMSTAIFHNLNLSIPSGIKFNINYFTYRV